MVTQYHDIPGLPTRRQRAHAERRAEWLAEYNAAEDLLAWVTATGPFAPVKVVDDRCVEVNGVGLYHWEGTRGQKCDCVNTPHPLVAAASYNRFVAQMRKTLDDFGGLTPAQHSALVRAFDRARDIVASQTLDATMKAEEVQGEYVGEVGQRLQLTFWVRKQSTFENPEGYGPSHLHICEDLQGRSIVYKGVKCWSEGAHITVRATVKEHRIRKGRAQTVIARPKTLFILT